MFAQPQFHVINMLIGKALLFGVMSVQVPSFVWSMFLFKLTVRRTVENWDLHDWHKLSQKQRLRTFDIFVCVDIRISPGNLHNDMTQLMSVMQI